MIYWLDDGNSRDIGLPLPSLCSCARSRRANAAQGLLTSDASRIGVDMEPRTAARETASWWKRQPVLVEHSRGTLNGKRAKQRVASVTVLISIFSGRSRSVSRWHTQRSQYCMQGRARQADASQMTMHIWEMIRSSGRK